MDNSDGSWFPLVFSDKCDGCAKSGKPRCVEFCPNGVFTFQNGHAEVTYPAKCGKGCSIPHCTACAPLCHNKAISFPNRNESNEQIPTEKKDLLWKTTCKVCGKQYWTNSNDSTCFDCKK